MKYFVIVALCLMVSSVSAQVASPPPPSAVEVVRSWQKAVEKAKLLRSYEGFAQTKLHTQSNLGGNDGQLHHFEQSQQFNAHVLRNGEKFEWDIADGSFEWNPKVSPYTRRWATSFDGSQWHWLFKPSVAMSSTGVPPMIQSTDAPDGFIQSDSYRLSHPGTEIQPLTLAEIRQGKTAKVDSKRTVDDPTEVFRNHLPYPLEPADILADPFNSPDSASGCGNLPQAYLTNPQALSLKGVETINSKLLWHITCDTSRIKTKLWLPSSVWFEEKNGSFRPVRFEGYTGKMSDRRMQVQRLAEVLEYGTYNDVFWPAHIVMTAKLWNGKEYSNAMSASYDKSWRFTRFGENIPVTEIVLTMPPYALVVKEGVVLPQIPFPDPPHQIPLNPIPVVLSTIVLIILILFFTRRWFRLRKVTK